MSKIIDQMNGKTLSESSMEKLKPFMNSEKQAQMFASMNRKQRRAFLAKNKKELERASSQFRE